MKNTWGIVSLDGVQKRLVPEREIGISILGILLPSVVDRLFVCT